MSSAGISTGNFRNSVVARIGRTPGQAVTELQTSTNMALASAAADSFPRTRTRRVLTPSGTGGFARQRDPAVAFERVAVSPHPPESNALQQDQTIRAKKK